VHALKKILIKKFIDMKKEIFEFICPASYLQYIFYADTENLTTDEINRIEDVLSGYSCFSVNGEPFFAYRNDFNNLGADCITLIALKYDRTPLQILRQTAI
jgi:hypothetical protein